MNYIAVDLGDAVPVFRFLRSCKRWTLWLLILSPAMIAFGRPITALVPLFVVGFSCTALRRLQRDWLKVWIWVVIACAALGAVWSFWELHVQLTKNFPPKVLLLYAVILLDTWLCYRVLQRRFFGGPRTDWTVGTLSFICLLVAIDQGLLLSCLYLIVGIACALTIPWALLPVLRSLNHESTLSLVRAISCQRSIRRHSSYRPYKAVVDRVLMLRVKLRKRPIIMVWLAGAVLFWVAGIFWCWMTGLDSLYELRAIPLWAGVYLGAWSFVKAGELVRQNLEAKDFAVGTDFTLYLRSFQDDRLKMFRDGPIYRIWPFFPLFTSLRFISFEKMLTDAVWGFGTVVSVGRETILDVAVDAHKGKMWQYSALQLQVSDQSWHETLAKWIERARYVLIRVQQTEGLKWEFQRLVDGGDWEKTRLVFSPDEPSQNVDDWQGLCSHFPWLTSCPEDVVRRSIAVRFADGQGTPVFVSAGHRSVASYELALSACWLPLHQFLETVRDVATH